MKIPQTPFSSLKMKPTLWKGEKKWGREQAKKPTRVAYENTKSLKIGFISTNTSDWAFSFFSFFELCTFFYSSQMVFELFSFPVNLNIEDLFYHWMKQYFILVKPFIYDWIIERNEQDCWHTVGRRGCHHGDVPVTCPTPQSPPFPGLLSQPTW